MNMGSVCLRMAVLTLACAILPGCRTIVDLFGTDDHKIDMTQPGVQKMLGKPCARPGVVLNIQVGATGVKPVEMEVQVDQQGKITLPYLLPEPVQCDGLTIAELQAKLVKAYEQYIRQPQVTARFGAFDTVNGVSPYGVVNVMGEVVRPGPVNMPATMDLTVTKALMAAGGTKPFADKRKVRVSRCAEDGTKTTTFVDLVEIGEKGRIDKDIVLKPGDVVYVHETIW